MNTFRIDDANGNTYYIEANNDQEAIQHVIDHKYKYSNWSILKQDTTVLSRKDLNNDYYICAYINTNSGEVMTYYEKGHWSSEKY